MGRRRRRAIKDSNLILLTFTETVEKRVGNHGSLFCNASQCYLRYLLNHLSMCCSLSSLCLSLLLQLSSWFSSGNLKSSVSTPSSFRATKNSSAPDMRLRRSFSEWAIFGVDEGDAAPIRRDLGVGDEHEPTQVFNLHFSNRLKPREILPTSEI